MSLFLYYKVLNIMKLKNYRNKNKIILAMAIAKITN